jgi:hypothetical protein
VLSPESETPPSETNILAVLAAQERYVLELKEELTKAEADLKTLKKHYALHEASKRRNDVRKITALQPVNTLIDISSDKEDEDGSNTWMQREMERRRAHSEKSLVDRVTYELCRFCRPTRLPPPPSPSHSIFKKTSL